MKKKIVAIMLASMLAVSATACGGSGEPSEGNDTTQESNAGSDEETVAEAETETEATEPEDDGIINFDGEGYNVTYVKHETGTDYEGNPCQDVLTLNKLLIK